MSRQSAPKGRRQDDTFTPDSDGQQGSLGKKAKEKLEDKVCLPFLQLRTSGEHKTSDLCNSRQEFFLNLLNSASTKREAKPYLSRFKAKPPPPPAASQQSTKERDAVTNPASEIAHKTGVNLGNIFGPARAVEGSPVFSQAATPGTAENAAVSIEKLHVALVNLRDPQSLDDGTIRGVARTLSQLKRLGMSCCVVVDVGNISDKVAWRETATRQADRLSAAIDMNPGSESRRLDSLLSLPFSSSTTASVLRRDLLLSPLRRNQIVVMVPVGYAQDGLKATPIVADEAILTLTRELAGLGLNADPNEDVSTTSQRIQNLQKQVSVDRLIVLDQSGGIPALRGRAHGSHVFVNLEQEYDDIVEELSEGLDSDSYEAVGQQHGGRDRPVSPLGKSNPWSKFVEDEVMSLRPDHENATRLPDQKSKEEVLRHINNLKLLQQSLTLLPPSSSAIITTASEAANSAKVPDTSSQFPTFSAVGTRRRRNPLIHNLLTDKPAHSPSLPLGRLGMNNGTAESATSAVTHSTFVKKGMPLTLLPDPRIQPWTPGNGAGPRMSLDDPRIDLPRLVRLIEDSFNRELDARHYMERVKDRLAGLIIAGEYEGGAILTWETPPGVPDDGSAETASRMVPYLDKFAVLKRSQGAGGVADIVFNAMVRTCFPKGVCWRSRRNNPVNKWYFERSRGTWKLPGANWTMFWTTDGVPEDQQLFSDYEGVCRTIEPSWADKQKEPD